ncbi:MAG: VWA domain-containing protein [Chthoniobacterales bacterium]
MNTDDVRITSYLLNELDGETRMAFEKEMANSAELQTAVTEIKKMRDLLNAMPATTEELSTEQRNSLRDQCAKNLQRARKRTFYRNAIITGSLAAAACVLLTFILPSLKDSEIRSNTPLASRKQNTAQPLEESTGENMKVATSSTPVISKLPSAPLSVEKGKLIAAEGGERNFVERKEKIALDSVTSYPVMHQAATAASAGAGGEASSYTSSASLASTSREVSGTGRQGARADRLVATDAELQTGASDGHGGKAEAVHALQMTTTPVAGGVIGQDVDTIGKLGGENASMVAQTQAAQTRQPILGDIPVADAFRARTTVSPSITATFEGTNYEGVKENEFLEARGNPLSTFSTDVDTASYSNIRRFLNSEQLPPQDAVRTEELINYFTYAYPQPPKDVPFSVNLETAQAPWNTQHLLVRIGIKGRELAMDKRPASNFVFLIDVSGSMNSPERLPLLKRCLEALVQKLTPEDRVAIVVYAGSSGIALPSTTCRDKDKILAALNNLNAGGSTNGAQGIQLAYNVARENFLKKGNNRVILCTDGDFNVGITGKDALTKLIEGERTSGVFLSALGFGTDNLKDATMTNLADKGNGNYAYVDSFAEGRKVLVEQLTGTLFTIAKDVKIQVEFNPTQVAGYRLIGYEKRLLAKEDFNNDKKDAGEIGAGHTVTAFYEVVPAGQSLPGNASVDPLKYQKPEATEFKGDSKELMTVKLRYKEPTGETSKLIVETVNAQEPKAFDKASSDFQFAAAVAAYGMKLRNSPYYGNLTWEAIQQIARKNLGEDLGSYRAEFLTLIEKARHLDESSKKEKE